ncbi:hypothetical protein N7507_008059 [Penicillium longicatenatum]|nr:hypothetical protein N7507_008059 [Penicillium longicatenatum]
MTVDKPKSRTLDYTLRVIQLIFAIIVMGIDGYAIHMFHGHTVYEHFDFGNFYDYYGVPNAWGFLLFCAAWTILIILFHYLAGFIFADHRWFTYAHAAVEAVAVLSWLAGFIAVAIQISSNSCSTGKSPCGLLEAATVFGALEWLLFMVTAALTVKHVL